MSADKLFHKQKKRDAKELARRAAKKSKNDNLKTDSINPSTDVHELVEYLITLIEK